MLINILCYDSNRNYYSLALLVYFNFLKGAMTVRTNIILECVETGERLYLTSKNQRNTPERLELKKYSQKLRRKAIFREIKK